MNIACVMAGAAIVCSTAADCSGWMREAGFRDMAVQSLTSDQSMIVGMK